MLLKQHNKYDIKGGFIMDVITKKKIGQAINTLLAEQNKRQKDLAKELGVTDNTISYFVSGSRTPNLEQITTIADFFNVSTDFLLGRTKAHTQNTEIRAICDYTGLSEAAVSELHNNKELINGCNDERAIIDETIRMYAHSREAALDIVNLFIEDHMSEMGRHLYKYKIGITEAIKEHHAYIDNWNTEAEESTEGHMGHIVNKFVFVFPDIASEKGTAKEQLAKYELYEAADDFKSLLKELASEEERALREIKAEYKRLEEAEEAALIGEKNSDEEAKDSESNGNDN